MQQGNNFLIILKINTMGKKKVGRKKLFETESTTIAFRVPREVKTEIKLIIKTIVDKYKLKKHE